MFGMIASGRPVTTDFFQIAENHIVTEIPDAGNINHIVVFMTGQCPLPMDCGAAVHFNWPNQHPDKWQVLGFIDNNKPSAVFRISDLKRNEDGQPLSEEAMLNARVGISIENIHVVLEKNNCSEISKVEIPVLADFSHKMIDNLFNYAASFAIPQSQMVLNPTEMYIPLSVINKWYANFKNKLVLNSNFWRNN